MNKYIIILISILIAITALSYYLYGDEWIDPIEPGIPDENYHYCWKCNGYTPIYEEFLDTIECGTGDAVDYPYSNMPDCGTEPFSGVFRTQIKLTFKDGTADYFNGRSKLLSLSQNNKEIDTFSYILQARYYSGPGELRIRSVIHESFSIMTRVYPYEWGVPILEITKVVAQPVAIPETSIPKGGGWIDIFDKPFSIESELEGYLTSGETYQFSFIYSPSNLIEYSIDNGAWIKANVPDDVGIEIKYI